MANDIGWYRVVCRMTHPFSGSRYRDCVETMVEENYGRVHQSGTLGKAQAFTVLPGQGTEAPKPGQPSMLSGFGFPPSPATVLALVVIAVAAYFLFFRK
jgi:hypothetical protein